VKVSVVGAKNKLTQLIAAVDKGERVAYSSGPPFDKLTIDRVSMQR
jgi:hypothetical protein